MEPGEHALIERLSQENDELRQLWGEHLAYEHRLGELARLRYLTEPEQAEMARIKRKKLAGKDRIELLLGQARRAEG
jgi:uncharacterized protein